MLTGWQLQYHCGDENVKEIGIWIDDWKYEKPPGATGGKLTYTLSSVLRDQDNRPASEHSHKVTVLGLRAWSGGSPTPILKPAKKARRKVGNK
jgi:hypothetical protein